MDQKKYPSIIRVNIQVYTYRGHPEHAYGK